MSDSKNNKINGDNVNFSSANGSSANGSTSSSEISNEEKLFSEVSWKLVETYFKDKRRLVQHQINSFENFIEKSIPKIIENIGNINIKLNYDKKYNKFSTVYNMKIENIYISKPVIVGSDHLRKPLYPKDARLRNLTYSSPLFCDISHEIINYDFAGGKEYVQKINGIKKVNLGKIPIMLQSKYCILSDKTPTTLREMGESNNDYGGYFIVSGSEKVLLYQERICENRVFIFPIKKTANISYSQIAYINSVSQKDSFIRRKCQVKLISNTKTGESGPIYVSIPKCFNIDIPLFILFRALGINSDKDILKHIIYDLDDLDVFREVESEDFKTNLNNYKNIDINKNMNTEKVIKMLNFLRPSIEEGASVQSQLVALQYLSNHVSFKIRGAEFMSEEKKIVYVLNILKENLLPHLGDSIKKKMYFIGYMIERISKVHFTPEENRSEVYDDRDSFINKRVTNCDDLLSTLFRPNLKRMIYELKKTIEKKLEQIQKIQQKNYDEISHEIIKRFNSSDIERALRYALATGNWGSKSDPSVVGKKGIAQVLRSISPMDTLSHLRRLNAPISRDGGSVEPHKLHNTQWGVIDPMESPEGGSIGIVKNFALLAYCTESTDPNVIYSTLEEMGVKLLENIESYELIGATKVFVNGDFVGIHQKPVNYVSKMRNLRRNAILNIYTSVVFNIDKNEVHINTEGGRLARPYYIVNNAKTANNANQENSKVAIMDSNIRDVIETYVFERDNGKLPDDITKRLNWDNLIISAVDSKTSTKSTQKENEIDTVSVINVNKPIIEYIDVEELDMCMVAMTYADILNNKRSNKTFYNYTHCEIEVSTIMGVITATIPFPERNQGTRVIFYDSQGKQGVGLYRSNYKDRMDTMGHVLNYPQRPLTNTRYSKILGYNDIPAGQNPIVAIACHSGYNQEDSLIFNQSAIDRALFNSNYYKTFVDSEKKNQSSLDEEKFCRPEKFNPDGSLKTASMRGSYEHLDENGFAKVGSVVKKDDVIIGKVIPQKITSNNSIRFKDSSTRVKKGNDGVIDRVYSDLNGDGYRFCKVKIRIERSLTIGDKFTSRAGQKGTIGMTFPQEDMPFTASGIVPDMIASPFAFPKRMTIGQLAESVLSKISAVNGHESDATAFNGNDLNELTEALGKLDFHSQGVETFYDGKTGQQIRARIFVGPTFYHRLKHMVKDKIHSRTTGPYQLLTRQPTEGRNALGGLRLGEMERDVLLAHGATQFLKERTFDNSDKFMVYVCKRCGMIAVANPSKDIYKCTYCKHKSTGFAQVQIPYASKLFMHELMALGVSPRFDVQ